jgi:hypothetical protein
MCPDCSYMIPGLYDAKPVRLKSTRFKWLHQTGHPPKKNLLTVSILRMFVRLYSEQQRQSEERSGGV